MGRQLRPVAEGLVYKAMRRACVIGLIALVAVLAIAGLIYFAINKYGYHWVKHWPFLIR